jgi:hypothetical protein
MDLSYPIGKFQMPKEVSPEALRAGIRELAAAPGLLREAVRGLDDAQLDTPYRPGGWTVRQVVHHIADSHMNAYMRFRLALTEDQPAIKPYDQAKWADLADARRDPVEVSLALIDGMHQRLVDLMDSLAPADFSRTFRHPERGVVRLDSNLLMYAWHSRHHTAHITGLRQRMGW